MYKSLETAHMCMGTCHMTLLSQKSCSNTCLPSWWTSPEAERRDCTENTQLPGASHVRPEAVLRDAGCPGSARGGLSPFCSENNFWHVAVTLLFLVSATFSFVNSMLETLGLPQRTREGKQKDLWERHSDSQRT